LCSPPPRGVVHEEHGDERGEADEPRDEDDELDELARAHRRLHHAPAEEGSRKGGKNTLNRVLCLLFENRVLVCLCDG
jgi:hypothetical protein